MTTSTPARKTAVIFAGEVFDGHDPAHPKARDLDGNLHDVRVRAMPARRLGDVLRVCTDEAALLELTLQLRGQKSEVGGQPEEAGLTSDICSLTSGPWLPVDAAFVDNLDDASHVALLEAAKRLNFSRAANWGNRQIEAKQFQAPLLLKADEMLSPIVEKMAALLISSLKSSGSPAAPATKS